MKATNANAAVRFLNQTNCNARIVLQGVVRSHMRPPGGAILVRRHDDLRRLGSRGAGVLAQDAAECSVLQILG